MEYLKKILPHFIAIALLAVLAVGLFSPTVFDNKVLQQHDNFQARGMQGEITPFIEKEGRIPLWTNQVFVGMPTFQLVSPTNANLIADVGYHILRFGTPIDSPVMMLLLMMAMVYISLLILKIDYKIAILGALSFGMMTSNILFIEAGHSVKMYALAFVPPMLAAAVAAFRGNWIWNSALFSFFFALNLAANHIQITYYTAFILVIIGIASFVEALRSKKMGQFAKACMGLAVGGALAVGTSVSTIWTTYEYAEESTRGKSELTAKAGKSGLDRDYALGLSFEKKEALTLMMPFFYGGSQTQADALTGKKKDTEVQKYLAKASRDPQIAQKLGAADQEALSRSVSGYWGSQTMVGGPIYFGVILCLLFFLGAVIVRGTLKWILVSSMGLLIILAWGKFFPLTDILFDNFPMYNKFRDVKMTLLVGQCIVVFLGALGIHELLHFDAKKHANSLSAKLLAALKLPVSASGFALLGGGIAALFCALGLLYSFIGTPSTPYDEYVINELPELIEAAHADRAAIIRSDAFTSLVFVLIATGLLWWVAKQREKAAAEAIGETAQSASGMTQWLLIGGLFILSASDLLRVDFHYLDKESFKKKEQARSIPKTEEDAILAKLREGKPAHETHFRVLDYRFGMPSQNAYGGYNHKIVGGYHAAKPMLFLELVDKYRDLDADPQTFLTQHRHIAEMLNVRYVLTGQGQPLPMNACGNAWLVNNFTLVDNADAELDAIGQFDPRTTAILQKKYEAAVAGLPATRDSLATIRLTAYHPEVMTYESESATETFAVFSEMYYPPQKGWKVFIDNQPVEGGFVKVNYLLRGLRLPAGKHTIEMRFEPASYYTGEKIALFSSIGVLLFLAAGMFFAVKGKKAEEAAEV